MIKYHCSKSIIYHVKGGTHMIKKRSVLTSLFLTGAMMIACCISSFAATPDKTFYGDGYCYTDNTHNMIAQASIGYPTSGGCVSTYTKTKDGSNVYVAISSNAFSSADDLLSGKKASYSYGKHSSTGVVSMYYTTSKPIKAVSSTHTNASVGYTASIYLFGTY
jgi:hypothetical protein